MRHLRTLLPIAALFAVIGTALAQVGGYVPQAIYCSPQALGTASPLCSVVPGDIAPDPLLAGQKPGYKGIIGALPTGPSTDVESPFDNYSWQTFVGLNWIAGKTDKPADVGLKGDGQRVWQTWSRVNAVFGNSPVQANCTVPPGYALFSMGSNGKGQPTAQNEEYIQAATLKPAIDINGNFTLYERRLNSTEIAYLKNPVQGKAWDLTTYAGQLAFASGGGVVNFPGTGPTQNGAMEIKAAWRILDPSKHADNIKKFYVIPAVVAVSPDLVERAPHIIPGPICAKVELGLVAMHIIQKNVNSNNQLLPKWFWTTFEQVDNAPLAAAPCDISKPVDCKIVNQLPCPPAAGTPDYSYYNRQAASLPTNQPANFVRNQKAFMWNPDWPYAKSYLVPVPGKPLVNAGTQIARCWGIYKPTQQINAQWQAKLKAAGSVFANYMLIGTQWGGSIEPEEKPMGPLDAIPNYLSNSVVETFLQTFYMPNNKYSPFTTGSCINCHSAATLTATARNGTPVSSNFSFLPGLVSPGLVRTLPPAAGFTTPKK